MWANSGSAPQFTDTFTDSGPSDLPKLLPHKRLKMEPVVGIEPTTDGLQNRCSTTELNWPAGIYGTQQFSCSCIYYEYTESARRNPCGIQPFRLAGLGAGGEFKADFAAVLQHQEGGEGLAGLGDEAGRQIGPPVGQQFAQLGAVERLAQDGPAGPELARLFGGLGFFAKVLRLRFQHAPAAEGQAATASAFVKSIFTAGPPGAAGPPAAPGFFGARGSNSKPTLPPGPTTRKALKGRPFLEMNFSSKSVRPVANNFCAWAGSRGRCRMTLPVRKAQPWRRAVFSQM